MGERRNAYRILVGKPEGKRLRVRRRRRWEDNITMHLQEVGRMFRAGLGYGQVAETYECGNEPAGSIKCGEFLY